MAESELHSNIINTGNRPFHLNENVTLKRYSSTGNTHYKVPFLDVKLTFVCCECMRNCGVLCLQRNNYK